MGRRVEFWGTFAMETDNGYVWHKAGLTWTWRPGGGINLFCSSGGDQTAVAYFRSCREAMCFVEGFAAGKGVE